MQLRESGFNEHYESQLPTGCHDDKRLKEKRAIRADSPFVFFARWPLGPRKKRDNSVSRSFFRPPQACQRRKRRLSNLPLLSVLGCQSFLKF